MALGTEINVTIQPRARLDVIDVAAKVAEEYGDLLSRYRKALYYSYHTTAGFLEQRLSARLNHNSDSIGAYLRPFRELFPPDAEYRHDQLHLRTELTAAERVDEPRNADAHLTYIGSGLNNLVTYENRTDTPVYLIELDGMNGELSRTRKATVIGFDNDVFLGEVRFSVPMSHHRIDSVNLKDRNIGLFDELRYQLNRHGLKKGRIELALCSREMHVGLTVNEYETLLMKYDLLEVLRNPLRFMAERSRHILRDPRSFPTRAKGYAKYDFVHIMNEFLEKAGLEESLVERLIHKFMAFPAARFLKMRRSISLLVSGQTAAGAGDIVEGTYQSPILVQWATNKSGSREIKILLYGLE